MVNNLAQNGFSRRASLIVLSLILCSIIVILSYTLFQALKTGNDVLVTDAFDLLKAVALVLFGGFVALIKDLFRDDPKITISDVKDIIETQKDGVRK